MAGMFDLFESGLLRGNRTGGAAFDVPGGTPPPEPAAAPRPTTANIPPATGPEDAAIRRQILEERAKQMGIGTKGATATPRPAVSGPGVSPTAIGAEAGKTAAKGFGARLMGALNPLLTAATLMAPSSAGEGSDLVIDQTTGKPFPRGIPLDPKLVERAGIPTTGAQLTPDQIAAVNMTGRSGVGARLENVTPEELALGERNYQVAAASAAGGLGANVTGAPADAVPSPKDPVMPTFGGNFADVPRFLAELGAYGAAIGDKRTAAKTARAVDLKTIEAEGKVAEARAKAAAEAKPFTVEGLTGKTVVQGDKAYSLDEKGNLTVKKVPATAQTLRPGLDPAVVRREAEAAVKQGNVSKAAINQALKDNNYNFQVK